LGERRSARCAARVLHRDRDLVGREAMDFCPDLFRHRSSSDEAQRRFCLRYATNPVTGRTPALPGKTSSASRRSSAILQQALKHGAQIGRRPEVAIFMKVGALEAGPVGDHAPALERAADDKRNRRRAMVGSPPS
jgi:hypothetical protein